MAIFKGAGVAIVTPMKENEEVNYDKLEELVEWQIEQGTDAIVIVGTTGESSTLTTEEHSDVIRAAVRFAKHRVPVIAGTGSNCTREAIHLSEEAEKAGADGLLAVTPYYNKATQGGLIRYYTEIADPKNARNKNVLVVGGSGSGKTRFWLKPNQIGRASCRERV